MKVVLCDSVYRIDSIVAKYSVVLMIVDSSLHDPQCERCRTKLIVGMVCGLPLWAAELVRT